MRAGVARFATLSSANALRSKRGGHLFQSCHCKRYLGTFFNPPAVVGGQIRRAKLVLGSHVKEALSNGCPVVALESTVITHGLPEPQNLELALNLERIVSGGFCGQQQQLDSIFCEHDRMMREAQQEPLEEQVEILPSQPHAVASSTGSIVTPATIGIVKGQLIVGLSRQEIEHLSRKEMSKPIKASRRDIPIAMALGLSAGTTVSATMAIACSLKHTSVGRLSSHHSPESPIIKVFATGGTGGVHVGGESSMDISADLYEFARSPIGVVSSGFKSFLDTKRSLEFLETMGCTVMSLAAAAASNNGSSLSSSSRMSPNDEHLFPAFFSSTNKQKVKSPHIVKSIDEAARILFHCLEAPLANRRGLLLAVPIPSEFSLNEEEDEILCNAMASVSEIDKRADLEGKEKTPLILEQLNRATGGKTLRANIELLKNNANIGAQLALKYAELSNSTGAILERGFEQSYHSDTYNLGGTTTGIEAAAATTAGSFNDSGSKWITATGGERKAQENDVKEDEKGEEDNDHVRDKDFSCGPVVVGCTMIDMHVTTKIDDHFKKNPRHSGVTFVGRPHLTLGGVGRNLATAVEFLGHKPVFVTSLARDNLGSFALAELKKSGFAASQLKVNWSDETDTMSSPSTSCFALVLMDSIGGQCEYVIANLDGVRSIDRRAIQANANQISHSPLLVMDANLIDETIEYLIEICHQYSVPIFMEPTDVVVLPRLVECLKRLQPDCLNSLLCLSPNLIELKRMVDLFEQQHDIDDHHHHQQQHQHQHQHQSAMSLSQIEQMARKLMETYLPQLKCLLVTMDKRGVLVAVRQQQQPTTTDQLNGFRSSPPDDMMIEQIKLIKGTPPVSYNASRVPKKPSPTTHLCMKHFPPPELVESPVSASGAGDSFAAGFISGLLEKSTIGDCINKGFKASLLALQDKDTISRELKNLTRIVEQKRLE